MRKIFIITTVFLLISTSSAHAVIPQFVPIIQTLSTFLPQIAIFLLLSISLIFKFSTWKGIFSKVVKALSNPLILVITVIAVAGIGSGTYFLFFRAPPHTVVPGGYPQTTVSDDISKYVWENLGGNAARAGNVDGKPGPEYGGEIWAFREALDRAPFISSAAVVGGRVYVGCDNNYLYCFDAKSSRVIWKFETEYEVFSSPAVAYGKVYVGEGLHYTEDAKFYCVDAQTGKFVWHFQTSSHTESSPAVSDGKVYFGAGEDGVYCLDAETGEKAWQYPGVHVDSSPIVVDGWCYFGSGYGISRFHCVNALNGTLRWKYDLEYPAWGGPAVVSGKVYFAVGNGNFNVSDDEPYGGVICLRAEDGEKIWSFEALDSVLTSVAIADGKAYFGSRDSKLYCLNAGMGEEIWNYQTNYPIVSSPAVAGLNVYSGCNDGKIYCLSTEDGELKWSFDTGKSDIITFDARILASPTVADSKVYVGSMNFYFYCIGE